MCVFVKLFDLRYFLILLNMTAMLRSATSHSPNIPLSFHHHLIFFILHFFSPSFLLFFDKPESKSSKYTLIHAPAESSPLGSNTQDLVSLCLVAHESPKWVRHFFFSHYASDGFVSMSIWRSVC